MTEAGKNRHQQTSGKDVYKRQQYMGGHAEKGSFVSRVELYRIEQFRRYIY